MIKVVITGGCGYIGSRLALSLSKKGHKVIVVDKVTPEERGLNFPEEIEFRKTDLKVIEEVDRALEGADYILHLAANIGPLNYMHKHQAEIIQENSAIDSNIYPLALKHKIKGIVYSSSSMVFQHSPRFPYTEEDIDKINPPSNIYGLSKLIGEYFCKAYQNQYGLPYVIIRYHNTYGPGEDSKGSASGDMHVIPALLDKILVKKQYPVELLGDPDATRPFVYVDDVIRATEMIFEKMVEGDKNIINNDFNIGGEKSIKIKDLAKVMWELLGDSRPFQFKPVDISANTAKMREGDIAKIRNLIGWRPETDLRQGILKTAEWIKSRAHKPTDM